MMKWTIVFQLIILLLIVLVLQCSKATRPTLFHPFGTTNEPQGNSTIWAVLVAGSNGYENYRHQADVCHAYQILKRGGLKDENIIVFMYDDIANDPSNPRPGVIINSPNGSDVYAGVPKDYTGDNVTADNFYAVLLGNDTEVKGGSGKVVASKPNDKIFIYFTDHGSPGVLCMPNMPYIYANDFINVLKTKHASGTYDEMVIYVEACESGSIFEGLLPTDMNIYATTASNATESSWAAYCPSTIPPPPPGFDTCLGDLYSVSWMENRMVNSNSNAMATVPGMEIEDFSKATHPIPVDQIDKLSTGNNLELDSSTTFAPQNMNCGDGQIYLTCVENEANRPNFVNAFKSIIKPNENATTWAVLVAGSSGYFNYRHQADVCHAYQVLKKGGLKDENIVVFMYDDIANDPYNPRKGVIINSPDGSDVYAGVPKDYTGESVTPANFYAVLLGNTSAVKGGSGKVVASKPEDRIFVFYSDHGGPGVLAMPNLPNIFANDFINVLKTKHAMGTYDEMVIYLEACESGSIFEGLLPKSLNIYVTTASGASEDSFATYCPGIEPSPPQGFDTCLGDLYSISWMEDSDSHDLSLETLKQQYMKVKKRTLNDNSRYGSHVMQYGTLNISKQTVSMFQGSPTTKISADKVLKSMSVINQREADLYSMWQKYKTSTVETQQKKELLKKIKEITTHRAHLDSSVNMIKSYLLGSADGPARDEGSALVDDWDCLKSMIRTFETHCGSLTQYGLKHTRTFANICNNGVTKKAMDEAAMKSCRSYKMGQWDPAIVGYSA